MMVISLLLCLFKALLVAGSGGHYGAKHGSEWNYHDGIKGPSNWSTNYPYCGGSSQSPINILTKHVTYNKALGTLQLQNYAQTTNVSFVMKNRNTDIEFTAQAESGDVPQAVIFKGTTYRLFQFHFHWGSENYQGSEHLIDWQRHAGEMHIIHYNTKYVNVTQAHDKPDGLLVWAQFLKVDSMNKVANTNFQRLLDNFGDAVECCNTKNITLNLKALLPSKYEQFYHYSGSLTTPPCFESVTWIVNKNPILVSQNQMDVFRTLKDVAMGPKINKVYKALADHFRPVQQLNNRAVEKNFDASSDVCETSAGVSLKPFSMIIILTVVAYLPFIM